MNMNLRRADNIAVSQARKDLIGPIAGGLRALSTRSAARLTRRPAQTWRPPPNSSPVHRTILAIDIERSTARTDVAKARLRAVMYDLLEAALRTCGIVEPHHDPFNDRGDGAIVLIHPVDSTPKSLLLSMFAPLLNEGLAAHNARDPQRLRLRAAVHAGEVSYDRRGCFGEAIDLTFRLLESPGLKAVLRHTSAPLAMAVSDQLYQSVVRHGYDGLDVAEFSPLVQVELAGRQHVGWIQPVSSPIRHRAG